MRPDPLVGLDGRRVRTSADWFGTRRPEIRSLFEQHMYGRTPSAAVPMTVDVLTASDRALGGRATAQQVRLTFDGRLRVHLLLYLPAERSVPSPVFVGLNFQGNEAAHTEGQWPFADVVGRGYGVATAHYEEFDPDVDDFDNGVHPLFDLPEPREWGAVGAWAWGLSRMLDHLVTDQRVDADRVVAVGHSRLGKAAMWAAAQDDRFAMAVSNNSGCGGVALSRRRVGETVEAITTRFPHWFRPEFAAYAGREEELPIDQHLLVALIAPRPVYIASAQEDTWADPYGEFLGGRLATPVYELLGTEGLAAAEWPRVEQPVRSRIGYHLRPGGHDLTAYDWQRFADVADRHLPRPPTSPPPS